MLSRLRRLFGRTDPVPALDWYCDGPPRLILHPLAARLAYELEHMPEAKRVLLLDSETPSGWPAHRWAHFYDRPGGWVGFKRMCEEVWKLEASGVPAADAVALIEQERKEYGFTERSTA